LLTVHNQPVGELELEGLRIEPEVVDSATSKFDLNVHVGVHRARIEMAFAYDTALFDAATIAAVGTSFRQVLESVCVSPSLRLSELPTAAIANSASPGAAAAVGARADDLVTAFQSVIAAAPAGPAVCTPSHRLSYGALDGQSNDLAQRLLAAGLRADGHSNSHHDGHAPRVGLMVAQDASMVVGMLGILKAGGAYVPLEPSQPAARLAAIASSAKLTAVVCDDAHVEVARTHFGPLPVIVCENLDAAVASPNVRPAPESLAYILYTSGTMGEPKGVMQTHAGVVAQVDRYITSLGLGSEDRLSLLSGYGFDAAVQDVFGALLSGACVYPLDLRTATDAAAVVERIAAERMTVVHATPTVFRHLFANDRKFSDDLSAVRLVVLGGEAARRADFEIYRSRFARRTQFVNGYGLTESTMGLQFVADHDTPLLGQQLPLGLPVGDLEAELFDAHGAVSWQGEIRLRGAGVFAGYWPTDEGRTASETAHRDAANVTVDGWYCTGDLGRRLPDGQLFYTGRRDTRLKIRGQRVEPGEIEAALNSLPDVTESAVREVSYSGAEVRLVAYVVTEVEPSDDRLDNWRRSLAKTLPLYMVPQTLQWMSELPRRSNGKVALDSLPAPGMVRRRAVVPPRTELETVLTGLWCELLPVEVLTANEIGVHDDFFARGGHSLLATRLISRIRDRLGVEIELATFFAQPNIAAIAAEVEARRAADTVANVTDIADIPRIPRRPRRGS
jgi:amino acid adenylation domain-containing protein